MTTDPWRPPDWRVEVPQLWAAPRRQPAFQRRDVLALLLTTVAIAMLGAPVGLLWSATSGHVDVQQVLDSGSEEAFGAQFGADAHFLVICAVMGLVCAVVAVILGRRHGPGVVLGLAVGGLAAALIAARVGYVARHDGLVAELHRLGVPLRATSLLSFKLRATGALVVWPIVAVGVFAVAALIHVVEPTPLAPAPPPPAAWPAPGAGVWPPGQPHGFDAAPRGSGSAPPS